MSILGIKHAAQSTQQCRGDFLKRTGKMLGSLQSGEMKETKNKLLNKQEVWKTSFQLNKSFQSRILDKRAL